LPYPCALKLCLKTRTAESDPEVARRQFATLAKVARAIPANDDYRVPRPHLLMKPEGAVLMEWVAGKRLTEKLFVFGGSSQRAQVLLESAAAWLRNFHAGHPQPPSILDAGEKLDNLDEMWEHDAVKGRFFDHSRSVLMQSADAATSIALPRSWVHGDFKSDNLIFSRGRMFGVDVHAAYDGIVMYDIAAFLNHIELNLNRWKHPQLWFYKLRLFRHFVERYLEGSRISFEQARLPLAWVRLYMLLSGWERIRTGMKGSLRGRFLERQYRAALVRVSLELEECLNLLN
jgi:hypothetical protein